MYEHLLVPIDGSDNAKRAAKEAAFFTNVHPTAFVELLYVTNFKKSDQSREKLEEKVATITNTIEDFYIEKQIDYKVTILHGQPAREIIRHANSLKVDLIIIGSRGVGGLKKMVLGSVSEKVVTGTDAPVLVIK